ncbi:MAG: M36 family metallopeptidase [Actinobacteria bacterium]|nr:M36 family metallopeptidase [Actinomycetota bacterium]
MITFGFAALALTVFATAAVAAKPGPGSTTGTGRVFYPNPVALLQDQTLTDQKDADYAALQDAYRLVTLTNLDGSGTLTGDYANIRNQTGDDAYSPTNEFLYGRSDDRFEQVMAYYWITEAQNYFQDLGFGTGKPYRPVNEESQDVRINQWGVDNSYSWDKHDVLRFGKGGVDDAEDAEVILHEYGHAVHDAQGVDLQGVEAGGIGEGFGDYLAVTISNHIAPTPDAPCVADWDAVSYTSTVPHCLRRIDTAAHYPENLSATSVHRNGLIWSAALWDIQKEIGRIKADTTILEAHFSMGAVTTMPYAAGKIVETAARLYGAGTAAQVRAAFQARGVL